MKKEEEKKHKHKLKLKFKILIFIVLLILYMFLIGPKGIYVKDIKIETNKIDKGMHGLKIVQFSDLYYGSTINKKYIDKLVTKINNTKPDIVIFTGGLLNNKYEITDKEIDYITNKLTNIKPLLGKYYVSSNSDKDNAIAMLESSNFDKLDSNIKQVYLNSSKPINLVTKNTVTNKDEVKDDIFNLLVLHNPNDIDKLKDKNIDMIIAGHTLNGQVNIPKLKELFIKGNYKKEKQKVNGVNMYINPGLGTRNIKVRLFNHPTIYLYRITKQS